MLLAIIVLVFSCFMAWAALAASLWQPVFFIVPILTAIIAGLTVPQKYERCLWALPIVNLAAGLIMTGSVNVDYLRFVDTQNFNLVYAAWRGWDMWLPLLSLAAGGAMAVWGPKVKCALLYPGILAVIIVAMLAQSACLNPGFFRGMATDSGSAILGSDNSSYRQVYYRLCQGQAYYPAYIDSFMLLRQETTPNYAFGYRLPGSFVIWKYLSFRIPMLVPIWYLLLSGLAMWAVYETGRFYWPAERCLLAPIMLGPLLVYGIPGWHFLMADYWAMLFYILAWPFLVRRNYAGAALLMVLSVTIREFMLAPAALVAAWGLYEIFLAKKLPQNEPSPSLSAPGWLLVPLAAALSVLGSHLFIINHDYFEMLTVEANANVGTGYSGEGWSFVLSMLQFAAPMYGRWDIVSVVATLLSLVSIGFLPRKLQVFVMGFAVIFLAFAWLHGGGWRNYWGINLNALTLPAVGWLCAAWASRWERAPEIKA